MNLPRSEAVSIQAAASTSGTERSTIEGRWAALGFALPGLLTEVWRMQESRMDIHPAIDTTTRYDVVSTSPVSGSPAATIERIRGAITQYLQLTITTEARSMDVWVLTAPANPVRYSPAYESGGGGWVWNADWTPAPADVPQNPEAVEDWLQSMLKRVPAIGVGFPDVLILPCSLGVLLLGDPEEDGSCQVQIECMEACSEEQIRSVLREELGITATKERRSVDMLFVRPRFQ